MPCGKYSCVHVTVALSRMLTFQPPWAMYVQVVVQKECHHNFKIVFSIVKNQGRDCQFLKSAYFNQLLYKISAFTIFITRFVYLRWTIATLYLSLPIPSTYCLFLPIPSTFSPPFLYKYLHCISSRVFNPKTKTKNGLFSKF